LIRINLLTEARAAAAKKKGPTLPTGARLNNLLLIGGVALGIVYIGVMALLLTNHRRRLDEEIGKAREEVARLKSLGATDKRGAIEREGEYWVRMNDPEGNEFCVQ